MPHVGMASEPPSEGRSPCPRPRLGGRHRCACQGALFSTRGLGCLRSGSQCVPENSSAACQPNVGYMSRQWGLRAGKLARRCDTLGLVGSWRQFFETGSSASLGTDAGVHGALS